MAQLREILVRWSTASGGGKVSVFNFEQGIAVATQRAALETMLDGFMNAIDNSVSYQIDTTGREFEDSTGTLTGTWTDSVGRGGTGAGSGEPLPDADQALVRWNTSAIINGRFLHGRTFIPGVSNGNTQGGNLASAVITAWQTLVNSFIASGAGLVVWHRPIQGVGGSHEAVSTASIWSELAVLRRRRS